MVIIDIKKELDISDPNRIFAELIILNFYDFRRNISSYQQQQQQTHTTYKVQSNQYSSTSNNQMLTTNDNEVNGQDNERPGSRLKQNIDELDTLLSDLNNARKDTTPSGGQHIQMK